MSDEVWVLGATGRTGRAIARRLHDAGVPLVLVGRDRGRVEAAVAELGGVPRPLVGSLASTLAQLDGASPGVVVNTVGPFTTTALQVTRACPAGTHYVDVSNELASVEQVLELDGQAAAAGQVFVTGAGFGVLGTESVVLSLCAGRPAAAKVRVDALPSIALEAGVVGAALAATIVEVVSCGGREVGRGRLVRARPAAHYVRLTTPHGEVLGTGSGANGELIAAWRASGADSVVAASTAAPASALLRSVLPAVTALFRLPGVGPLAVRGLARIPLLPRRCPDRRRGRTRESSGPPARCARAGFRSATAPTSPQRSPLRSLDDCSRAKAVPERTPPGHCSVRSWPKLPAVSSSSTRVVS